MEGARKIADCRCWHIAVEGEVEVGRHPITTVKAARAEEGSSVGEESQARLGQAAAEMIDLCNRQTAMIVQRRDITWRWICTTLWGSTWWCCRPL